MYQSFPCVTPPPGGASDQNFPGEQGFDYARAFDLIANEN